MNRFLIYSLIFIFLTLLSVSSVSAQISVPLYSMFETTVTNVNNYTNKFDFNEIQLDVTFTAPNGNRTIDFYGFHDGDGNGGQNGNIWKIRFMPDETGTWSYTYLWSGSGVKPAGGSGSFTVTASTSTFAPIKVDPLHPHYFTDTRGNPFFWNGDTEWFFLSHEPGYGGKAGGITNTDRKAAIDFLASKKVNNLLITMANDDDYDVYPFLGTKEPTDPIPYDQSRFNVSRMKEWDDIVSYMKSKKVIADLWFYSDSSGGVIPPANSAEEDLYFKYMIARFASYSNISWNLALEYSEYRSAAWVTTRAANVKALDPYNRLLSVHQRNDDYDFDGNTNLDHTSLQRLGASHSVLNNVILTNRSNTANAGKPIPICHEEFYIEGASGNETQNRQGMWAITLAGGCFKSASLGWWIPTPAGSLDYGTEMVHFDDATHLFDFVHRALLNYSQLPYSQMQPSNNLRVSGSAGYVSSIPGSLYLVYLPSGGSIQFNLSGASGRTFKQTWFNPQTGQYNTTLPNVSGGTNVTLTTPSGISLDSVVLLEDTSGGGGNIAPVASDQTVTTEMSTNLPITLSYNDPDGPIPYTFTIVQQPLQGSLSGTGQNRTYTPTAGFTGTDSFTWTVRDGSNALSNTATVSITVTAPPSQTPVADDIVVSTATNTPVGIQMTFTDSAGSGPYVFSKVQDVQNGILTNPIDSNDWSYAPNPQFIGTDSFTWTVEDGDNNISNIATVTINVGVFSITNISAASLRTYEIDMQGIAVGKDVYSDRANTFIAVPNSLTGSPYIRTANDDKSMTQLDFLSFDINRDSTVYIGYDNRATALPSWLSSWQEDTTSGLLDSNDTAFTYRVFKKSFPAGTVTLGANKTPPAAGAGSMYAVVVVPNSSSKQGDTNNDQQVDSIDINNVITNFNSPTFIQGDFNQSGMVNILDLSILLSNFGM